MNADQLIRLSLVFMASVSLVGCINSSTGVVPMGQNTYTIAGSSSGTIGTGEVKARLLREASAWCSKQGLVMVVMDARGADGVVGHNAANSEITFKALPPAQAQQAGPVYRPPNQIIETRYR